MNTMATFWIVAALVMAASVGALVYPMLKPAGGAGLRAPKRLAAVLAVALPLAAVGLYLGVGSPAALTEQAVESQPGGHGEPASGHVDQGMDALVARLAARLKDNPADGGGWELLARSYVELRQFPEAAKAFETAAATIQGDPQLLADYADALAMANGGRLAGKPMALVKQALALDPKHQKALLLAASGAFADKNYREAIKRWQQVEKGAEPGSEVARDVAANIAEARALLGEAAPADETDGLKAQLAQRLAQGAPAAAGAVSGRVELAAALAARVSPSDTLFVYARPGDGSKMPLAILRLSAGSLPARFALDDSLAMASGAKLSDFREVTIVARISKTGGATPQSGDLVGEVKKVSTGTRDLRVLIDSTVP